MFWFFAIGILGFLVFIGRTLRDKANLPELVRRYPYSGERPALHLWGQSGTFAKNVGFANCLDFAVCPSGLRIGVPRWLMPLTQPFLVPWHELSAGRQGMRVTLTFGRDAVGALTISDLTANRLARAARQDWPERGPISPPRPTQVLLRILAPWAIWAALILGSAFWAARSESSDEAMLPYIGAGIVIALSSIAPGWRLAMYALRREWTPIEPAAGR